MTKVSVDLNSLDFSGLSYGQHKIRVKARGGGYLDSPLSEEYITINLQVADLAGTTWYFNETVSASDLNGRAGLTFTTPEEPSKTYQYMYFQNGGIWYMLSAQELTPVYNNNAWKSEGWRTVHITGGENSAMSAIITWFYANATMIGKD